MKKVILLLVLFLNVIVKLIGDEYATTESGKKVLLRDDGTWEYIEEIVKEKSVESLLSIKCPQEISLEFSGSFTEKFSHWRDVILINLTCFQKENGIMINLDYRSLETTALRGWFANWKVVTGSAKNIVQSAFEFPQVIYVELDFYNPYKDEYGNVYYKHEVTMQMERDLAEEINWNNFTHDMLASLLEKRGLIKVVDGEKIQDKK